MRGEFVEHQGDRLYYYAAGSRGAGDPVVFLHGFPTSSHLWAGVIPQLPAGRRYVVVDLAGCGRSVLAPGGQVDHRAHAKRVHALLTALRIDRCSVVAHGTGAHIALALGAALAPGLESLALIAPAPVDAPLRGWGRLGRLAVVLGWLPPSIAASYLHGAMVRRYQDRWRAAHSADLYARPFASDAGRASLVGHVRALRHPIATADMGLGGVRASITCGDTDETDQVAAAAFAGGLPTATLHHVAGAGHLLPEEAPEQLARILASFLFP